MTIISMTMCLIIPDNTNPGYPYIKGVRISVVSNSKERTESARKKSEAQYNKEEHTFMSCDSVNDILAF